MQFLHAEACAGDRGGEGGGVDESGDVVDAVLGALGDRLRRRRRARAMTLADLAAATGVSASLLSRLETGRRRPTADVLLQLARVHQVTLDDLVGAPATADPSVHPRPSQRFGMTWLPLNGRPGGIQAYKLIIPAGFGGSEPEQRSHEGYEWLYVLTGRLRLLLGNHDLELLAGEVAEFDTHVPHAFTNPAATATEVLVLIGPQGQRAHVRARPARQVQRRIPGGPGPGGSPARAAREPGRARRLQAARVDGDPVDGAGSTAPDDEPVMGLATAERVCAELEDIARPLLRNVSKPVLAEQVRDGFLGVGPVGASLVCRYDPAVADVERWQHELAGRLGAADAGLVRYVPARRPPAELVAIERVLSEATWHPDAGSVPRSFGIDWEREVVEVTLDESAPAEVVDALRALGGDALVVHTGGRFSRRGGRRSARPTSR